jgi:hypothetical protein
MKVDESDRIYFMVGLIFGRPGVVGGGRLACVFNGPVRAPTDGTCTASRWEGVITTTTLLSK